MQTWLRDTRTRTRIDYRDETLQPVLKPEPAKPQRNGSR
jgi:hypothetical protein